MPSCGNETRTLKKETEFELKQHKFNTKEISEVSLGQIS